MVLAGAPDVDHDLVAGAETVVLRGGHVLVGLEGEALGVEYLVAVDQPVGLLILEIVVLCLFLLSGEGGLLVFIEQQLVVGIFGLLLLSAAHRALAFLVFLRGGPRLRCLVLVAASWRGLLAALAGAFAHALALGRLRAVGRGVLLVVVGFDTLHLLGGDSLGEELLADLLLALAGGGLRLDVVEHLLVGERERWHCGQQRKYQEKSA